MILFVNPPNRAGVYQSLGDSLAAIEPPLWCRLLSSYCENKGIKTDILDLDAEETKEEQNESLYDIAYPSLPDLAVVVVHGHQPSASTQSMPAAIEVCKFLKDFYPEIPVLIVGGHPAALPERTLEETGADAVCTGEGPITIQALLEAVKAKWNWDLIPGLCYRDGPNGGIYRSRKNAENIWNLTEEMPGGMWDKLPMDEYRAHNWHCLGIESRQPYASIYTSLGCSFACSFCNIQAPFREGDALKFHGKANSYRMWLPKMVVDEIELLATDFGVTNIKITDEMFWLNKKHVEAICDEIIRRDLKGLNFWFYGRVDTIGEDMGLLEKALRAGMRWACLGIEAASSDVRDGVDKNDYGIEDIFKTCDRIRRAGLNIMANLMVGLPSDTHESMQETLDMAFEIMPDFLNIYATMIYPGAPLWKTVPEEKRNYDWRTYGHHSYECVPAGNENLTPAEVLDFRDNAFQKFYTSPSYQSHVLAKFGPKAVIEIAEMVQVPLKRKLLGD